MISNPTQTAGETREYWSRIARQWDLLGPPLRPTEPDLNGYWRGLSEVEHPKVAVLGATLEFASLPWPEGSHVVAVDLNRDILHAIWPGKLSVRGDWRALPLRAGSRDAILCDGGLSMIPFPDGCRRVAASAAQVLRPGGLALIRAYLLPSRPESSTAVLEDLLAGRIPSLNHLKLRLGMALQAGSTAGVRLADIWDSLHEAAPSLPVLAERIGWDLDRLEAIHAYRSSTNSYYFSTLDEILEPFSAAGFELQWVSEPDYEMGSQCPVICFRRAAP